MPPDGTHSAREGSDGGSSEEGADSLLTLWGFPNSNLLLFAAQ
jgi:hypothetical protein